MATGLRLSVNGKNLTLHFLTVVGSQLHGLAGENSDRDVKGVFSWDKDVVDGLKKPSEQLDNKNMKQEDRLELMGQLNKLFDTEFDEDLDLFEGRKFFLNSMKSEPNMLDMLWANTVPNMVLFCSDSFQKVLDNRKLFLNPNLAKLRFLGMSFNTLKLGSKNGRSKDLAKSLQSCFSFLNLVSTGEHSPRLTSEQEDTVREVKFNALGLSHEDLIENTKVLRNSLELACNELELEEEVNNFDELNALLLTLSK